MKNIKVILSTILILIINGGLLYKISSILNATNFTSQLFVNTC